MAFNSIIDYTFFAFYRRIRRFITDINLLKSIFCFSRQSSTLIVFSVILSSHFYAQVPPFVWAVATGTNADQQGRGVTTDGSGNVYSCGYIRGSNNNFSGNFISAVGDAIFISKYDSNGNFVWVVRAGGASNDEGFAITTDAAGFIYVTGFFQSTATFFGSPNLSVVSNGGNDIFVAKYDPAGNVVWVKNAGGPGNDCGLSISTNSTNVYVTGYYTGIASFGALTPIVSNGNNDVFVASYNAATGLENWAVGGGSTFDDAGNGITVDASGVYATGVYGDANITFQNHPGNLANIGFDDAFLVKYDLTGNGLWKLRMGNNPGLDAGTSVCVNGNNVYLAGYYSGTMSLYEAGVGPIVATISCTGTQDAFVAQYNATTGLFGWAKSVSGSGTDKANGIVSTPAGDVIVVGYFNGTIPLTPNPSIVSTLDDPFIIKYNSAGTLKWGKKIAGANSDILSSISTLNNFDVHVCGWMRSSPASFDAINVSTSGNDDIFFAKIGCTVTTSSAGSTQTVCSTTATLNGNTPTEGSGIWSVVSGTGTVTTPTSPTSGVTGLGIGSTTFRWTITNGTCVSFSDQIIIRDNYPTTSLAGSNQTLCASTPTTTMNGNSPSIGTGSWTVISGTASITSPTLATTTITAIASGTNIFQWTISNGACSPSTSTMSIIVDNIPATAIAGPNQTLCASNPTTTMNGNVPAIGTGSWTVISGTASITNPTLATTAVTSISTGTNIFQWTISNSLCSSSSSTVLVQVDQIPTIAMAGSSQTLCSGFYNMGGNAPAIGTGTWTLISGSASISSPNNPNTSVTALGVGTNIFQWTIGNGVCPSSSSTVSITRDAIPTTANAGVSQTLCASNPTTNLSGNNPAVGTGSWTVISGSGNILSPSLPNTGVTAIGNGTNIFEWVITSGVCPVSSSTVLVQVDQIPTIAMAGSSQSLCSGFYNMGGNTPSVGTGTWTLLSGSATITSPNNPNTSVTALGVGTNVFQWAIGNGVCPSSTSTVSITRDPIPTTANAGVSQTLCVSNPTTNLNGNNPAVGTGLWTVISGTATISTPTLATSAVTAIATGTNVLEWTISNGVCPSSSSQMNIIVNQIPTIATAGSNQTLCASNPTLVMNGNIPSVGNGSWTVLSGSGSITSPTLANTSVTAIGTGTNIFRWTISNGVCAPSSATMSVQVDQMPTTANAGINQTLCASNPNSNMTGNIPAVGTGSWTVISGTATITSPTSGTTAISGIATGTNVFQWNISNGSCATSTSTMAIFVDLVPTTALAGSNQTLCASNPTFTMMGNTPSIGTGSWTVVSGTASITSPTLETTGVTAIAAGTNIFQWSISNGTCAASTSTMSIQVDQIPTTALAGSNQTLCASNPTFTMMGNTPSIGTGLWTVVSGTASITSPTLETTGITAISSGTNIFQWSISNGVCSVSTSTMSIQVDQIPTTAVAGSNQTLCASNPTFTMTGNTPSIGTGSWTVVSGTASITSPTIETTGVTAIASGTNIFQWAISNGICAASTSTMSIQVDQIPTTALAGSNQTLCASNPTFTMIGNTPSIGTGSWTVLSGTASITSPTLETTGVTGIASGTNIFQWAISNGICAASTSTMSIQVDQIPTTALAGSNQTLCASNPTFTMMGNTASVGTGSWTVVSGTASITSPALETTGVTGIASGTNIFEWAISNGTCAVSTSTMSIQVDQIPTTALAGSNQTLCASNPTFTMMGNTPSVGIGYWNLISGTASITSPTLETTDVTSIASGINIFQWTISNGTCAASTSTMSIQIDQIPTTALAGSNQTLCASTVSLNANNPVIGTGIWSVLTGTSSITTPTLNTSEITNLNIGANSFIWSISNGICATLSDTVDIFVSNFPDVSVTGSDYSICETGTFSISANNPSVGIGTWSVISGTGVITNSANNITTITAFGFGDNIFRWTIANAPCPDTFDDIKVTVYQKPSIANAGEDQLVFTEKTNLNANLSLIGNGNWINLNSNNWFTNINLHNTEVNNLDIGANTFVWQIQNGVCPLSYDTIIVTREDVVIPSGFSPNGDGVNDYFYVKGIETLGNVSLTVFNRWGNIVYENDSYSNNWNGKNKNAEELSDDTYYFILKQESEREIKGYIILKR